MNIVCLDMEGVLVPEIWIAFSEASGIPERLFSNRRRTKGGKGFEPSRRFPDLTI